MVQLKRSILLLLPSLVKGWAPFRAHSVSPLRSFHGRAGPTLLAAAVAPTAKLGDPALTVEETEVLQALTAVIDPDLGADIVRPTKDLV